VAVEKMKRGRLVKEARGLARGRRVDRGVG
jgi:hypothetical protein